MKRVLIEWKRWSEIIYEGRFWTAWDNWVVFANENQIEEWKLVETAKDNITIIYKVNINTKKK